MNRKSEIINVAARLFKEKGYSAVTMRDIAQSLDIKAASLYNHIKSKQEILVLIVLEIAKEYTTNIRVIEKSDDSAVAKITNVINLHIDITVENPDALASLNNDWMHLPKPELQEFLDMREEYETIFRRMIRAGIASGEFKNYDSEVIIFSLLSTIRTLYLWYGKKQGFSSNALKANLPKILLQGII